MREEDARVLTLVRVVCRENPRVEALTHAVQLVQAFVAPKTSLAAVLENNPTLHLLELAIHTVEKSSSISYEKCRQFRLAMRLVPDKISVANGALQVIKELYLRYPNAVDDQALQAIIATGDFSVLQWLYSCEREKFEKHVQKIFAMVSRKGEDEAVRWLVDMFPRVEFPLDSAVAGDHMEQLQWLLENACFGPLHVQEAFQAAVDNGNRKTAQLLHRLVIDNCVVSVEKLAEKGNRAMIQWIYETCEVDSWDRVPKGAASSGRLDVLQYLHIHEIECCWRECMDVAAGNGHLEVVKWLHANRTEGCSVHAMDTAAGNGYLEVVKWLYENRAEVDTTNAAFQAARNGHVHVLEWLYIHHRTSFDYRPAWYAAKYKHYEALKWLVEHGAIGYIDLVAGAGNLEMVELLHSKGGICTNEAMDNAAGGGCLEVLKFLHNNRREGCTRKALNDAASNGHLEVVKWLLSNYWENCRMKVVALAASNGHLDVVKYLLNEHRSGGLPHNVMIAAASNGDVQILAFLATMFYEWPSAAMKKAVCGGHVEAVKWLYSQARQPLYSGCGVDAARAGNVDLLEFIRVNSDYCNPNSLIFSAATEMENIEVVQWCTDHFGITQ